MKLLSEKENGTVIKYMVEKNYGFIRPDNPAFKDDVFIHVHEIEPEKDCFKKLLHGERVQFELYRRNNERGKGLVAKNLIIIGDAIDEEGDFNGNIN